MDPDALPHQLGQDLPEALGEAEVADDLPDALLLLAAQDLLAGQRLRLLQGVLLGEVDDVDRCVAIGQDGGDRVRSEERRVGKGGRWRGWGGPCREGGRVGSTVMR